MRKRLVLKIQDGPGTRYSWTVQKKAYRSEHKHKNQKIWVHQRLLEKAKLRLRNFGMTPEQISFEWCGHCKQPFVRCPECRNNTCNGGSPCGRCYHYQELALISRNNIWPTKENFPNADQLIKEAEGELNSWGENIDDES